MKITIFKMMVLWSVTLKIGALTKLGLFFPVVCFIHVFDQSLAEQLYSDKRLLGSFPYCFQVVSKGSMYLTGLNH